MGKKTKRKTRWRSLPIDVSSQNEEDGEECEENGVVNSDSVHQNGFRKYRPSNGYNKYHHYNRYSSSQPASQPSGEKKLFNEDEYTKITTPRQDVLFKKGYLGRRRAPLVTADDQLANGDHANDNGECPDNQSEASSETVTSQEHQAQLVYTNGYVDHQGGPVFYLNGAYEMYDPYTGAYTSYMVPAGFPTQNGGVLTAVPCQPLPLQPLEWFNPRGGHDVNGGWCFVPPPCQLPPPAALNQRKKRYSTDSQNCSPNSSESTGPPGSPQQEEEEEEEEVEVIDPGFQQPAYMYPGYMFGPAVYNVNGVAAPPVPASSNGSTNGAVATNGHSDQTQANGHPQAVEQPINNLSTATSQSSKKRKKKRRRKRRTRGEKAGTDEGSEETSSEEGVDEKEVSNASAKENGDKMSSSSPGPGPSESCSELSPASSLISSHNNSQDETEVPKLPQQQQQQTPPSPPIVKTTVVLKQEEETTVDEGEEEAVVTASILIRPTAEQETIQQLLKEAVEEPAMEAVQVAPVSAAPSEPSPPPKAEEKKGGKITRKGSRKAKHAPTPSPTPNKASSEESLSEVCSVSPVPPPRRRSKAKHRPATPLPLSGDEDLVEQVVALASNEAPPPPPSPTPAAPADVGDRADAATPKLPITEAVTTWLQTANPALSVDSDVEDEDESGTGPKNAQGNPLPAPSNSGGGETPSTQTPSVRIEDPPAVPSRTEADASTTTAPDGPEKRVARLGIVALSTQISDSCSELSAEWDASWDAPALQGDKFYRLTAERPQDAWLDAQQLTDSGIESGDEPPPAKFVRHLPDSEPLPCAGAVCCSIQ